MRTRSHSEHLDKTGTDHDDEPSENYGPEGERFGRAEYSKHKKEKRKQEDQNKQTHTCYGLHDQKLLISQEREGGVTAKRASGEEPADRCITIHIS